MLSKRFISSIAITTINLCNRYLASDVRRANQMADDAYILGYETGYDKGWTDARKHEHPIAVTFLQRTAEESAARLGVELQPFSDTA